MKLLLRSLVCLMLASAAGAQQTETAHGIVLTSYRLRYHAIAGMVTVAVAASGGPHG